MVSPAEVETGIIKGRSLAPQLALWHGRWVLATGGEGIAV